MEVRKVRFDETFQPGEIDFSSAGVRQSGPLHVEGEAELLANTAGEIRIKGHLSAKLESECDWCLAVATFPVVCDFDLFYRYSESLSVEEEVEIAGGEVEMGVEAGAGIGLEGIVTEQR